MEKVKSKVSSDCYFERNICGSSSDSPPICALRYHGQCNGTILMFLRGHLTRNHQFCNWCKISIRRLNSPPGWSCIESQEKHHLRNGAWNTRTLLDQGKAIHPIRISVLMNIELSKYKMDIVASSETRFPESGHHQEKKYI